MHNTLNWWGMDVGHGTWQFASLLLAEGGRRWRPPSWQPMVEMLFMVAILYLVAMLFTSRPPPTVFSASRSRGS
jgi:hypothetical protein